MSGCCTGAQTNCPLFFSSCKPYFLLDSETPLMKHRSIQWHCLSCEILEKQCQWVNFKWQTALIPYTYVQILNIGILEHTSDKQYFPCNTHMLNISDDHLSFLKHTSAESEKHVFFLKHVLVEQNYFSSNTHLLNYPSPRAQPFTGSWWNTEEKRIRDSPEAWIESISLCVSLPTEVKHLFSSPRVCNTQELSKSSSKQACTPYFYQDEQQMTSVHQWDQESGQ